MRRGILNSLDLKHGCSPACGRAGVGEHPSFSSPQAGKQQVLLVRTLSPYLTLLIRHALSKNPFALSLSKCEWILVLRQAQHERQLGSKRAGSIGKFDPFG